MRFEESKHLKTSSPRYQSCPLLGSYHKMSRYNRLNRALCYLQRSTGSLGTSWSKTVGLNDACPVRHWRLRCLPTQLTRRWSCISHPASLSGLLLARMGRETDYPCHEFSPVLESKYPWYTSYSRSTVKLLDDTSGLCRFLETEPKGPLLNGAAEAVAAKAMQMPENLRRNFMSR